MNRILCPECVKRLYPNGHEEKSCTHGLWSATSGGPKCVECGRIREVGEEAYSCLGTMTPEEEISWLRRTEALEEERGEIVPGGAQGGVIARARAKPGTPPKG